MSQIAIRGGTIIDGTGGPARRVDLGIRDGRVEEIGEPEADGDQINVMFLFLDILAFKNK